MTTTSTTNTTGTTTSSKLQERIVQSRLKQIKVTAEPGIAIDAAIEAPSFKQWLNQFQHEELTLNGVYIQNIDFFRPGKVGFIKFIADVERQKKKIPGITFLRGGAVAILTILVCNGIEYVLGTVQPRVPIGRLFLETPAGMLESTKNFVGDAAREMKEETEITITADKLIDLTTLAYGDRYPGIIPSAGGCDEFIRCFVYRQEVTPEKLQEFHQKLTGVLEEGEFISLRVMPLEEFWKETSDVKALCCLFLYYMLLKEGKINWDVIDGGLTSDSNVAIVKSNNPLGVIDFYTNLQQIKAKLKEVLNNFKTGLKDSLETYSADINAIEQNCDKLVQELAQHRRKEVDLVELHLKNGQLKAEKFESEITLKNELEKTKKLLDNERKAKSIYQISLTMILCMISSLLFLRWIVRSNFVNLEILPVT